MTTDLVRQDAQRDVAVADPEAAAGALAHILGTGDLSQLTNEQRVGHYLDVCSSLGLNPRTRPFDWIEFYDPQTKAKKLALYPNRSCAEQLRRQHQISVRVVRREMAGELFVVEMEGTTPSGRVGTASKYVPVTGTRQNGETYRLAGSQLANAYMKAETGALRRLTFSMVGMASPPDLDELSRPRVVVVDGRGNVLDNPTPDQKALAADPNMARVIGEPVYEDMEASGGPLAGTPDQRATPAELARPEPSTSPRASFRPSEEDVKRWLGAWFATVKGLSLDADEARHRFVRDWTHGRTDSLRTFLASATGPQAGELLDHVRALMDDERRELLAQSYKNMPDGDGPSGDPVQDAFTLTGAPPRGADADESEPAF